MKHAVQSLSKRAAAVILAAALALPSAYASAGTTCLRTTQTLTDGLSYVNTVTQHSSAGRVESYSFLVGANSEAYPIMVQSSGTAYGAATINKAISYAESMGYNVIGGINSDFFGNGGVPLGISIENGIYKSSPEGNNAVATVNGQVSLSVSPQVYITLTNQRDNSTVDLTHFNKWRNSSGGLYLYNEDFSTISTQTTAAGGRMVRFKVVDNGQSKDLTVNSTLTLEVVDVFETSDAVPIGEDNYILTAAYESGFYEVFASYHPGDQVTLTTSCSDPVLSNAQWASGAGDIIVRNGAITDSSQWVYGRDGRNPRTALGVKADGTLVLYEVDGRQSGYSGGLSEKDLADELLQQGCQWAVNLDGGGSSILSARLPGSDSVDVQNSPSGGYPRSCATFILLVTDDPGTGPATRLALKDDGLVVLAGSSVTLGDVVSVNDGAKTVDSRVADAQFTSGSGLGSFNGSVYTAGTKGGTDTIQIYSPSLGLSGTAQIHVVTALSQLTVTKAGSSSAVSSLSLNAGDSVQLSATGTYWSREALRSGSAISVVWSVSGNVGTITQDGLFTANGSSTSGTISVSAGNVTKTIPVSVAINSAHTDVTPDHWAYDAVEYCYEHGIVSGISATEFGRDLAISRGDFVLMLYAALGRPAVSGQSHFTDVASTDYYADAITWASSNGLVAGISATQFGPKMSITREQAFTILHNALSLLGISSSEADLSVLDQFPDKDLIADYAKPHIAAMVSLGLASGSGSGIDPQGNLTRAEMAVLLYRLRTYDQPTQPEEPTVDPNATLTLDPTQSELASAQCLQIKATLTGAQGTLSWRSSDPTIATVSADGTVTNVYTGSGTAQVTITASLGSLSASTVITCGSAQQVGQVNAEPSLNVRSGPGTTYSIISSLANGRWVIILDDSDAGWYQVLFSNSAGQAVTGYVSADYVEVS